MFVAPKWRNDEQINLYLTFTYKTQQIEHHYPYTSFATNYEDKMNQRKLELEEKRAKLAAIREEKRRRNQAQQQQQQQYSAGNSPSKGTLWHLCEERDFLIDLALIFDRICNDDRWVD